MFSYVAILIPGVAVTDLGRGWQDDKWGLGPIWTYLKIINCVKNNLVPSCSF